jgi:hypothetical protein
VVVSIVGEILGDLAKDVARDGIAAGILKLFRRKKPAPISVERQKVLARRNRDRLNRRRTR